MSRPDPNHTREGANPGTASTVVDHPGSSTNPGRQLVSHFYMVAKTAAMFDSANVVTRDAFATFMNTLDQCLRTDTQVSIQMASDCLFVNETRLKIDFAGFASFKYLIEALKARGTGNIIFNREVDEDAVKTFVRLFIENDGSTEGARERISSGLESAGITSIWVEDLKDLPEEMVRSESEKGLREVSINTYLKTVFVAKQFMENLRGGRTRYFQKARRLVHSVVDVLTEDDTTMLALTQIKNFDNYLFSHSANVCVLSVALGQALGLDKGILANLGLAALLHDVGMTEVPREMLDRREELDGGDRCIYEQHSAYGARTILQSQGVSDASIRCVLVAFQHHLNSAGTGFPALKRAHPLSLLGRIVAVADFYDMVTTPREDGTATLSPDEALRLMAHEQQRMFDPILVKVFANTVGVFPLGTVVRLDTGETGVVYKRNPLPDQLTRPLLKRLSDPVGRDASPDIVDLAAWDHENDRYARTIVETIAPTSHFEDPRAFTDIL